MHSTASLVPTLEREILSLELQKSRDMLESFIYGCSHGIRAPLKSLAGIVILMKDYPDAMLSHEESYLPLIRTCVRRMEDVLVQFEELKVNAVTPFHFGPVNIKRFFKTIAKSQKAGLDKHKISVSFHISQKGHFYSDQKRMEMIFTRLISNAISFADLAREQRAINIFVTASPSGCSIQVHDNGEGIAPQQQSRIFDLFYRGSMRSTGTGMGLFIAKRVVESLGGVITVKSAENIGSNFSVWIPNMAASGTHASSLAPPAHNGSPRRAASFSPDWQDEIKTVRLMGDGVGIASELHHANALTKMFIKNYVLRMRVPVHQLAAYLTDFEKEPGHSPSVSGIEKALAEMDGIHTVLLAELDESHPPSDAAARAGLVPFPGQESPLTP